MSRLTDEIDLAIKAYGSCNSHNNEQRLRLAFDALQLELAQRESEIEIAKEILGDYICDVHETDDMAFAKYLSWLEEYHKMKRQLAPGPCGVEGHQVSDMVTAEPISEDDFGNMRGTIPEHCGRCLRERKFGEEEIR